MARIITGLFDQREEVEHVIEHLVHHDGVGRDRIRVHAADEAKPEEEGGFLSSLLAVFIPDADRHVYAEGVRQGGYVLTAELEDAQVEHALDVFEQHGAVDLDSRVAEWCSSGWTDYDPSLETLRDADRGGASAEEAEMGVLATSTPDSMGTAALNPPTGTRVPMVSTTEEEGTPIGPSQRDLELSRPRVRAYRTGE
ncbi:hypothetical protein [Roseomonas sp. BN140053]|uniref:hypothetical protein n=1 Tax=Roseomonas sp. BN140053 TaxID=3391898 RepID=UPI0039EBF94E